MPEQVEQFETPPEQTVFGRLNRIESKIDNVLDTQQALTDSLVSDVELDLGTDEVQSDEERDEKTVAREHMVGMQECYESEMANRNLAIKAFLGGDSEAGLNFYSQFLLQSQAYWFHVFEIAKLLAERKDKKKIILPSQM